MIYFLLLLVITFLLYLGYGVIVDLTENDISDRDEGENVLLLHKLIKNNILKEICGNVLINRTRIDRELLLGRNARIEKFLHQVVNGRHYLKTEGCNQVVIVRGDGY